MNVIKTVLFIFIITILNSIRVNAVDISPDEIIRNVQKHLDQAKLVAAEFVQTFEWAVAEEVQQFNGKIYLGTGDAFRIETEEQLIVSDGNSVWTYDKIKNQVIIDHLDKSQSAFLPRQLFLRYQKDYQPQLAGSEEVQGKSCYHLVLLPRDQDVYIQKLEAWIDKDDWLTKKIAYLDANDNTTTYLIRNIQFFNNYDADLFKYVPNNEVEIIDLRTE